MIKDKVHNYRDYFEMCLGKYASRDMIESTLKYHRIELYTVNSKEQEIVQFILKLTWMDPYITDQELVREAVDVLEFKKNATIHKP